MNIRYLVNIKSLFIFLTVLWGAGLTGAGDKIVSKVISFQKNKLTINAQKTPLIKILAEIQNKCSVKIEGLENRNDEAVTYVVKEEALENALKAFLRHLGANNYAFEFDNEKLIRVAVVSKGYADNLGPHIRNDEQENPNDLVNVVKITEVIGDSQAHSTGLMKDDLILEYDGLAIGNADELITATKAKSNTDQVEIIVLRENYQLRFIINGGFIGVRIRDAMIAKEDLAD